MRQRLHVKRGVVRYQYYDVREDGARVLEALKKGVYFVVACKAAAVSVNVARQWKSLGQHEVGFVSDSGNITNEGHVWFASEVDRILGEVEASVVENWVAAARENWQAGRDYLARRFPQRWGNTEHRQIEVHGMQQMELELVWDEGKEQDDHTQVLEIADATVPAGE